MEYQLQSAVGLLAIPILALLLSEERARVTFAGFIKFVGACLFAQIALAAFLLYVPGTQFVFFAISQAVVSLQQATEAGLRVVFGYLAGGPTPFDATAPQNGFILAFRALPLVLIISVLTRLLFLWGVLPAIVKTIAWALHRTLGITGPVGMSAGANIFVGMVEAPLLVRPYLKTMSRGGLFAVMTVGMSTVAGTVLGLYASILGSSLPDAAGHLLVASIISLPAALLISWIMVPQGFEEGPSDVELAELEGDKTIMGAITQGTGDGIRLLVFISAMMVVMVALVALTNIIIGGIGAWFDYQISFEKIVGWIAAPLAWMIGIPFDEIFAAGRLIGIKIVLNEFLAYLELVKLEAGSLSERSRLILTYALCGFANFGSLGIMTGGLVAMVPERRDDVVSLGPKTILSGTLATLMTGAVIGLLVR